MVNDVKPGGVFMINCQWDFEELNHHLKADAKRYIARNNIQLYTINAIDLAIEIGMGKRNNTILQSAFFSLAMARSSAPFLPPAACWGSQHCGPIPVRPSHIHKPGPRRRWPPPAASGSRGGV